MSGNPRQAERLWGSASQPKPRVVLPPPQPRVVLPPTFQPRSDQSNLTSNPVVVSSSSSQLWNGQPNLPSNHFVKSRKRPAIQIKNANGEVVFPRATWTSSPTSSIHRPAAPPPITLVPPPPPPLPRASTPPDTRSDISATPKTAKEIMDELKEKIRQAVQADVGKSAVLDKEKKPYVQAEENKPKATPPLHTRSSSPGKPRTAKEIRDELKEKIRQAIQSEGGTPTEAPKRVEAGEQPAEPVQSVDPDEDEVERMIREMEDDEMKREKEEKQRQVEAEKLAEAVQFADSNPDEIELAIREMGDAINREKEEKQRQTETAFAKTLSTSRHQPTPSIHSSALMSAWTKSTVNTQTSLQTSISSHARSVDSRKYSEAAHAVMASIEEDVEVSPVQDFVESDLSKELPGEENDKLDNVSLVSTTSTIFTPQQREDAIERFSRAILKDLRTNLNCGAATDWSRQHALPLFRAALKSFTECVELDKSQGAQVKGVKLIRHLRQEIARNVQDRALEAYKEPDHTPALKNLSHLTQMDMSEKIGLWCSIGQYSSQPVSVDISENPAESQTKSLSSFSFSRRSDSVPDSIEDTFVDRPGLYGASVNPAEILERIKGQPVFTDLVGKIEVLFEQYHGQKMHLIRQKTSLSLRRQLGNRGGDRTRLCAVFNIDWNPRDFLMSNYAAGVDQNLRKIIAITGQMDHAKLSPVGEYFNMTWPGEKKHLLLVTMAKAMVGENGWSSRLQKSYRRPGKFRSLSFDVSMKTLTVTGSEDFIISIAQQAAWLAAAFQEKKDRLTFAYVGFDETPSHNSDTSTFNIDVKLEAVPPDQERGRCWRNLVGPAVLIQGFPVPARIYDEQGLEADIATMAAISGTPKAVTFGGGFVFKARCHALVPTGCLGPSIQWHVLDTYPRKLGWEDIDEACPTRLRGTANNDALPKCRSFFGWCPQVLELLGTERFKYGAVDYSKAMVPSSRVKVEKLVFGFSQWVTFTANVSLGKRDGVLSQRPDDYETTLDDARDTHVILYDTAQKRAAQTNAEDLMLHLLLHRRENEKADPQRPANCKYGEPFVFANPDRRANPTRQVMLDNSEKLSSLRKQFSSPDAQARRFKDEVKLIYTTVDALWGNTYAGEAKTPVKSGLGIGNDLLGWEYMDVLNDSKYIQPKSIAWKRTHGCWNQYAKDIGAVVLFVANFGDVFVPAPPFPTCSSFASLPPDENYLAVKVDSLQRLFHRQGSLHDQKKLTDSGLTLHCHDGLFRPCDASNPSSRSKSCCRDRVVRLVSPSGLPRNHRPIALEESGAVIIGHVKGRNFLSISDWERSPAPAAPGSLTTHPRTPFMIMGKGPQRFATNPKPMDFLSQLPQVGESLGAVTRPKAIPDKNSCASGVDAESSVASGTSSSPLTIPQSSSRTASSNASRSSNRTWSSIASLGTSSDGGKSQGIVKNGRSLRLADWRIRGHS